MRVSVQGDANHDGTKPNQTKHVQDCWADDEGKMLRGLAFCVQLRLYVVLIYMVMVLEKFENAKAHP
jgi:hypothetical protein